MRCTRYLLLGAALSAAVVASAQHWITGLPNNYLHHVTADFGVSVDHPLVKLKFNLFSLSRGEQIPRDVFRLVPELNVDTVRLGANFTAVVSGTLGNLKYDFTELDRVIKGLWQHDVRALTTYYPLPPPLQDAANGANKHKTPPSDLAAWRSVGAAYARHYRETGMPFGIHEIWNEPDIRQFLEGMAGDYQRMYATAVQGIREADPDAVVGGPSAAEYGFYESFPDFVMHNKLPLDVFIFHHYGSPAMREIDAVAKSLARYPYFHTTEMNMNEYQSGDCCDWCNDDVRNRYEGGQQLLRDFSMFLDRPELTAVSWAWLQDPPSRSHTGGGCMGLVTAEGKRKAAFNAWKIYAMMPVDRNQVTIVGPVEGMASSDSHKTGLVVWNPDSYERRMDVSLKNVPFPKGTVRIYRIDKTHASVGDDAPEDLSAVETFPNVETTNWSWRGALPPHGTVYFEAEDGTGVSELAPAKVAKVVRVNHYYPARGTKSFADFDRKTWIARLGMADESTADQEVGVTAEQLPETLRIAARVEGKLQKIDANSLLGVRLDYFENGSYSKGVLFHGPLNGVDLYVARRTAGMPWGTRRQADRVVALANMATFEIRPKEYAPANWSGRVQMTFVLQDAGRGARAKITVRGK